MPYVINSKGKVSVFRPVRIAEIINDLYIQALGSNSVIDNRKQIMVLTQQVVDQMKQTYGSGDDVQWYYDDINNVILNVLEQAPLSVHELFAEQLENKKTQNGNNDYINNYIRSFNAKPLPLDNRHDNKQNLDIVFPRKDFWIYDPKQDSVVLVKKSKEFTLSDWLNAIQWLYETIAYKKNKIVNSGLHGSGYNITDSIDYDEIKKQIKTIQKPLNDDEAIDYWLKTLETIWIKDPVYFNLANTLYIHYEIGKALGYSWLSGTDLEIVNDAHHNYGNYQNTWNDSVYKKALRQHIQTWYGDEAGNVALDQLIEELVPERDYLLSFEGYEELKGVMRSVNIQYDKRQSFKNAYEPPQWLWIRIACTMANNQKNPTRKAIEYYHLLSNLYFIPSKAILRESGQKDPVFLEDGAGVVSDELESVLNSISQSLMKTKWTGNVSMDWTNVRSKGASIMGGLRQSQGVLPYWRTINYLLEAQGRIGSDRPITMIIPIWHKDILNVIDSVHSFDHLKIAIKIPDLFMKRVRQDKKWVLFDPKVASSLQYTYMDNFETNYRQLERQLPDKAHYRVIKATRLITRLIDSIKKSGGPSITFTDSNYASMQGHFLCGIDGVGALPYEEYSENWISWPTGVINLPAMLSQKINQNSSSKNKSSNNLNNSSLDIELMKTSLESAFSLLSNSIELDNQGYQYQKSIGIGVVGLMDCIELDRENWQETSAQIAEAWHSAMTSADTTDFKLYRFNPADTVDNLNEKRKTDHIVYFNPINDRQTLENKSGTSFKVKSIWAPFVQLAQIACATEGGIMDISPTNYLILDNYQYRIPSPYVQKDIQKNKDRSKDWAYAIQNDKERFKWSDYSKEQIMNDKEKWNKKIDLAATLRPWLDQGISISVSPKENRKQIYEIMMQSWFKGINSLLFNQH